jgi:hypothetical protein
MTSPVTPAISILHFPISFLRPRISGAEPPGQVLPIVRHARILPASHRSHSGTRAATRSCRTPGTSYPPRESAWVTFLVHEMLEGAALAGRREVFLLESRRARQALNLQPSAWLKTVLVESASSGSAPAARSDRNDDDDHTAHPAQSHSKLSPYPPR